MCSRREESGGIAKGKSSNLVSFSRDEVGPSNEVFFLSAHQFIFFQTNLTLYSVSLNAGINAAR
jgi:hypothetical protein